MLVGYTCCSFCGSGEIECFSDQSFLCQKCDKRNYINYSCAAGCYLYNDKKQILLAQRAREPYKGKYDDPGGFMDLADATVEEAVVRELQEELGIYIAIDRLKYMSSGTMYYRYQDRDVPVVAMSFCAYISDEEMKSIVVSDDVASVKWVERSTFNPDDMCTTRQVEQVMMVFDRIGA